MRTLVISLFLLVATAAHANSNNLAHRITHGQLSGVALNTAAATRTVTLHLSDLPADRNGRGWSKLRFGVEFTHNAATTVTAQFSCSYDGTTYYRRTTRSCSGGTCTVSEQSDSNAVSGDQDFELEYDIRGCAKAQILLGGASAGASDLVSTEAVLVVGD